ncbi:MULTISPECIES: hypothetical protein [unclassified Pseudonocardia]|uniref:hypothetical protein n=1 Tax=unclassified Pseudonocardia TaxID=2619320 RepID=UPI001ACC4E98|nr:MULTISPECIES: hypothetical protein [unclassified Pseudonocardia]MBN9101171.1 hypothetical protein [Pseudonocardia sp.]
MTGASGVLAVRVAWGVVLLVAPHGVLKVSHGDDPHDRTARRVLRILGFRHLAQTAVELAGPRPAVQYLGASVDGIHALTSAGLAAVDRRWRRSAVLDAAVASGFALGTGFTARGRRSGT